MKNIWEKLKAFFEFSAKTGLYFPMAYDNDRKKPSVTLFAFYISVIISAISVIALHFTDVWLATAASLMMLGMTFVFYRMRKLTSAKIDLDDKTIEFSAQKEDKKDN